MSAPSMISRAALAACATVVTFFGTATASAQAIPDSLAGRAAVSYVVGNSVYLNVGSSDRIYPASRVVVVHGQVIVAELTVTYQSSHSTSCTIESATDSVRMDDSVRFSFAPAPPQVAVEPLAPIGAPVNAVAGAAVHGSAGLTFQAIAPLGGGAGGMTQPAIQAQLAGNGVGGMPISFDLDARARRTYMPSDSFASHSAYDGTRVYQAWINWADARSGVRVTLGRQFSSALSPVSLFDGATVELDKRRWSVGAFAGAQPAAVTMAFSSQIKEYGAFTQFHSSYAISSAAPATSSWAITLGGIGSYDGGQINREFMFLQAQYTDRRFLFWMTQEVDLNRGWKADSLHEPGVQPTNTFATVQWTVNKENSFFLHGGFDNRRNVVLYRDYVSPVTQFDDRFRQGVWGGLSWIPAPQWRVGLDARLSAGGASGTATSYTASTSTSHGLPLQGMVRLRATTYTAENGVCADSVLSVTGSCVNPGRRNTSGWLVAGAFSVFPVSPLQLAINGGVRQDRVTSSSITTLDPQTNVEWVGIDADYRFGVAWYLLLSATYTTGGAESSEQVYTGISYRF